MSEEQKKAQALAIDAQGAVLDAYNLGCKSGRAQQLEMDRERIPADEVLLAELRELRELRSEYEKVIRAGKVGNR